MRTNVGESEKHSVPGSLTGLSLSRRRFLAAAAGAAGSAALAACGTSKSSSSNNTKTSTSAAALDLTLAFSFLENVEYAGWYLGRSDGYFSQRGLNVKFLGGGPNSPAPETQLQAGVAQVVLEANTVRLFSAIAKKQPLQILAQDFQVSPNGLLSLARRPVSTPAELKGARIIAAASNRQSMGVLMKLNGVTDYKFVPGGSSVDSLIAGQGDALLAFAQNQPIILETQYNMKPGKDFFFVPFSDLNYYLLSDVLVTTKSYATAHRAAVVDLLAGALQGWQSDLKNPTQGTAATMALSGTSLGLKQPQQQAVNEAQLPYILPKATPSTDLLRLDPTFVEQHVYQSLKAAGITGLPPASSVVDPTLLADARALIS